jgi:peptide/nickel transport system substrate-binding protein
LVQPVNRRHDLLAKRRLAHDKEGLLGRMRIAAKSSEGYGKLRGASVLVSLGLVVLLLMVGCQEATTTEVTTADTATGENQADSAASEELASLIEPFDPPTLEELDTRVTWIDQPVLDAMVLLREDQAKKGPPVKSVEEALALRNESEDTNAAILDALGRLPADEEKDVEWEAQIVRHIGGDVKSTNPLMGSSTSEFEVIGLTSAGLISLDWNMRPFGASEFVASWQTSEDGLYDKFVLRDDLVWSDGQPLTAEDIVFSFKTIMNPAIPVPAVRQGTDKIRWIESYDERTLVFFHQQPSATNVWNISFPIIPRHIYEDSIAEDHTLQTSPHHVKYEENPISGGTYKIVKRVRGQEIVLEAREDYYMHGGQQVRDRPYFKRVIFKNISDPNTTLLALKKGDIEECELSAEQWQGQTASDSFYQRNTKVTGLQWVYFYFCWNCRNPFFDDSRVRWAMSYAFDYEEMLQVIFQGLYTPCNSIFHPTAWMAPDPPLPPIHQDLDKSVELLEQAGWTDSDGDGILDKEINGRRVPFEFSIITSQRPNSIKCCAMLKESLDRIGIICHVRPIEFTVLQQKSRDHEFQAMMGGWGAGADPDMNENIFGTDADRNYGLYSNARVDELFEEGKLALDRERRAEIYGEIAKIIYGDQPYTCLFFRNGFYGFNKQLRGYRFSPRGPYGFSPGSGALWKPALVEGP